VHPFDHPRRQGPQRPQHRGLAHVRAPTTVRFEPEAAQRGGRRGRDQGTDGGHDSGHGDGEVLPHGSHGARNGAAGNVHSGELWCRPARTVKIDSTCPDEPPSRTGRSPVSSPSGPSRAPAHPQPRGEPAVTTANANLARTGEPVEHVWRCTPPRPSPCLEEHLRSPGTATTAPHTSAIPDQLLGTAMIS